VNVQVMTTDRKRLQMPRVFMELHGQLLGWVEASDGVWVPSCDLVQYEADNRQFEGELQ
jgi:hypothetical protein